MRTSIPEGPNAEPNRPDAAALELLGILSQDPFDLDALRLAEQSAGIGVWSVDLTTGLVRATAQFFRIMGLEPTRERVPIETIRELRHPDDGERVVEGFQRALQSGADFYEIEYRITRPDGGVRWVFGRGRVVRDAGGKPVRYSGIDLDITDRKAAEIALAEAKEELERLNRTLEERVQERTAEFKAEAQRRVDAEASLHQAQKMQAIGQLSGGIAHDFNNLLHVIMNGVELLQRRLQGADKDLRSVLDMMKRSASSAASLTQRILAFSRQQPLEPKTIDPNKLVSGMVDLLQRALGESIALETVLGPGTWAVSVDTNQLEAAILNLAVNARDAMANGGTLTIETSNARLDETYSGRHADVRPGEYALISVSDTGTGMSEEVVARAFDPFFTTKESGQGTGLGLSQVYGFIRQSGGHVKIESDHGKGTTVKLYLPRLPAAAVEDTAQQSASAPASTGTEKILVVEDNEDVRASTVRVLRELGYNALSAEDARSALLAFEKEPDICLLFTDVGLPNGVNGRHLADEVQSRWPRAKVLFTTAYANNAIVHHGRLDPNLHLIMKPFTYSGLAQKVRQVLDEAKKSARAR